MMSLRHGRCMLGFQLCCSYHIACFVSLGLAVAVDFDDVAAPEF
jgi:hypothetical protein